MSILENLWNGNIFPFERSALKTKEYRAAMKRTEELEQQLLDLLGPDNRKLLDEFERASDEAWVMEEQDAFALASHDKAVAAQQSGIFAEEIVLVNATMDKTVLIEAEFGGTYQCRITDCMGRETHRCTVDLQNPVRISVPVNGYVYMHK